MTLSAIPALVRRKTSWTIRHRFTPAITFSTGGNTARFLPDSNTRPIQISQDVKVKNWDIGPHRFPQSAQTFELGDFALFAIRPRSLRYVGGFAQAKTVTPEGFAEALGGPPRG